MSEHFNGCINRKFWNIHPNKIKSVKLEKCSDAANFIERFETVENRDVLNQSIVNSFPARLRFSAGFSREEEI